MSFLESKNMEWLDYREQLQIGFNDEKKGAMCVSLIQNKLDELFENRRRENEGLDVFSGIFDSEAISVEEYHLFCHTTGTRYGDVLSFPNSEIRKALKEHENEFRDYLSYYVALINCISDRPRGIKKRELLDILEESFAESRLKYAVLKDDGQHFIFPKGARELDNALVSEPLEWLSDYPGAKRTFVIALKQYQEGIYIRDTADNFRKALEAFLQEFLQNEKNLENNKNEIIRYLTMQGVDPGVSGLFQPLINTYKHINDRVAKHNDKVDEKLLEFLLYQTGILIRMVIIVKKDKTEATTHAD